MHSTRGIPGGTIEKTGVPLKHMEMDLYDKTIDDILAFPEHPKRITFSGLGEPLMNKNLGEMGRRLRQKGFTGRIDVITNSILLTPERVDELVYAGFSRIQISVQGLESNSYKEICGVAVDFDKYVDNIKYLWEHKRDLNVFIKIIDVNLKNAEERQRFFDIFGKYSDTINVEHLILMQQQTQEFRDANKLDCALNFNGEPIIPRNTCTQSFYLMQICIDGNVYPCSIPGLPKGMAIGNVNEKALLEIWNDEPFFKFMCNNLRSGYKSNPYCAACDCINNINSPEEFIDPHARAILERLERTRA
jgi:radical SAM protein with 4Fe4S-binding SPASM domain